MTDKPKEIAAELNQDALELIGAILNKHTLGLLMTAKGAADDMVKRERRRAQIPLVKALQELLAVCYDVERDDETVQAVANARAAIKETEEDQQ